MKDETREFITGLVYLSARISEINFYNSSCGSCYVTLCEPLTEADHKFFKALGGWGFTTSDRELQYSEF